MTDFQWRFGANFNPSTSINQLEMWQAETFDPATIDRELGFARGIGMSVMRVFLHDLAWSQDPEGFLGRMEQYLRIADRNGIKTMFVFFDDCWNDNPAAGRQPEPRPGIHNSGWVKSPGTEVGDDPSTWGRLEKYVKSVLGRFGHDPRVILWDLYNEPGNGDSGDHVTTTGLREEKSLPLLEAVFAWARVAAPEQPLTAGPWKFDASFDRLNRFMFEHSDVVTFHCYNRPAELAERINFIRYIAAGRPVLCSEYMARTVGSTFQDCLPVFKKHNISAVNWGLVKGRSNTIYPWGWKAEQGEPQLCFHDVFNPDGTLLHPEEAAAFAAVRQ